MKKRRSQSQPYPKLTLPVRQQLQALLIVGIAAVTGLSTNTHAESFQLFGHNWHPGVVQKTEQGWHHVYLCQSCKLTPSLTIVTSTEAVSDNSLFNELERAYDSVAIEGEVPRGQHNFTLVHATEPNSQASPPRVSTIVGRYKSLTPGLWHFVQAVIETANEEEESLAEDLWLNLLGHISIDRHSLTLFPQDSSVVVDISSPDRSWFSDFVEQVGVDKFILGSTVTTTGLLLLGAQVALGAANVKGPCGKPLGQCPCTKSALRATGLPVI